MLYHVYAAYNRIHETLNSFFLFYEILSLLSNKTEIILPFRDSFSYGQLYSWKVIIVYQS